MKLIDLTIEGFGVWSNLEVPQLSPRLTVVFGENEAGKTTVLQAIRATLYGFNSQRRDKYLPPLHGGAGATRLAVESDDASYTILRRDDDSTPTGSVVVTSDDGTTQGEPQLHRLLAGVNEPTFNHVFAIGLRELQELATLDDTEAAELLYDLSTGLERVSLAEVLRELRTSRTRLFAADGAKSQILELVTQRDALKQEIDDLSNQTPRYWKLLSELASTDQVIDATDRQCQELSEDIRRLEAAILVREPWHERHSLAEQIAAGKQGDFPPRALPRYERLASRLLMARRRRKQLRRKRQALRSELCTIRVNEPFWRQSARVAALAEHEPWIAQLEAQLREADQRIAALEAQHSGELASLGLPSGAASPRALSALTKLRAPARQLSEVRKRLLRARREFAEQRKATTVRHDEIQTALSSRGESNLAQALQKQGDLVSAYRRRIQLDDRLDQLAIHRQELSGRQVSLLDQQILPLALLWTLAAVFVLGAGLIIGGLLLPSSVTGAWGYPLAFFGLLVSGAAVAGKFVWERPAASRLESTKKQLHMLDRQLEQAKAERGELDSALPAGGGPLASRLQAAERELVSLEELLSHDAHRQSAVETTHAARARLKQAGEDWQKARRRWQQSLSAVGVPENLLPRQIREAAKRAAGLASREQQLELVKGDRERCRRELESLGSRIEQLAADANAVQPAHAGSTSRSLVDQLRRLRREASLQEELFAKRGELTRQIDELHARHARYGVRARRLVRLRRELFRAAGAASELEFRQCAADQARLDDLITRHAAIDAEIQQVLAGICSSAQAAALLGGDASRLEQEREALLARRQAAGEQTRSLFEQRGRLVHERTSLENDRRLGQKQLELRIIEQRLEETAARWRTIAVTEHLIQTVKGEYERDRQPEVLRDASVYLARMTGGRYNRVWTAVEERALRVDRDGQSLPIELLSSGAREQLFLSLRLALADRLARQGRPMPLVLDDVLVNFDAQRAEAAAALFIDWAAEGRQVLLFTCHEHIAERFQALRADVRYLPDNSDRSLKIAGPDSAHANHQAEPHRRKTQPYRQLVTADNAAEIVVVEDDPPTPVILIDDPLPRPKKADSNLTSFETLAIPSNIVIDQSIIAPPTAPAPNAPAPVTGFEVAPKPKPLRRRRADAAHRLSPPPSLRRRRWSAEEFDGELEDKVNAELWQSRIVATHNTNGD